MVGSYPREANPANPSRGASSTPSKASDSTPQVRVLVVDDHPAIRYAIANTVEGREHLTLCGTAESAEEAFELARETHPDVAVIDISLGDAHGLDLVQNLRAQHDDLQVVVFSMYDENVYAERALRAGALGYVMKTESTQSVAEAIRSVARGEIYLSRRMASRLLSKVAKGARDASASDEKGMALKELTDREMAVFQMLGQGCSTQEIADRLNLSRKTIETYRRRAKEKLGFDTISGLLQYAVRWVQSQK